MSPSLRLTSKGLRLAVEGCGHGVLHSIYASIDVACKRANWPGVDLVIIGGDFQSVRNADDLSCVSIPAKYRSMQDFHEYYSGKRVARYLTLFVGGNHEASNYLQELHYGGWVAPNIYYLGAANIVEVGGLRIAGMSGIWKGYDYRKPHGERLPYNEDDVRSIYHTREVDVRKLLAVRTQVDVGISHDWPKGVEWMGDSGSLFRRKGHLENDAREGRLGSVAAKLVLDRLRPKWWFSAHLHIKYAATVNHANHNDGGNQPGANVEDALPGPVVPISEDSAQPNRQPPSDAAQRATASKNDDEIDLDTDDDAVEIDKSVEHTTGTLLGTNGAPEAVTEDPPVVVSDTADDLRSQLPAAFTRTKTSPPTAVPYPSDITNVTTQFLALDKCLPRRDFLQLLDVEPVKGETKITRPVRLSYDKEWLAITRVFASDLTHGEPDRPVPKHKGDAHYRPLIEAEERWVTENIVEKGLLPIPENFKTSAPVYDGRSIHKVSMPREYTNIQTQAFCDMLEIANPLDMSEEQRDVRMRRGPKPSEPRAGSSGGGRGGGRGRGSRGSGFGRGPRR